MPKCFEDAEGYAQLVDNAMDYMLSKFLGVTALRDEEFVAGGVVRQSEWEVRVALL